MLSLSLSVSPLYSFLPSFLEALDLDTINNEVDGLGNSLPPSAPSLSLILPVRKAAELGVRLPLRLLLSRPRSYGVCARVWSRAMGPWARRVGGRRRQGRREAPLSAAASAKVALRGGTRGTTGQAGENPLRDALCARAERSQRAQASEEASKPPTHSAHRNHPRPRPPKAARRERGREGFDRIRSRAGAGGTGWQRGRERKSFGGGGGKEKDMDDLADRLLKRVHRSIVVETRNERYVPCCPLQETGRSREVRSGPFCVRWLTTTTTTATGLLSTERK